MSDASGAIKLCPKCKQLKDCNLFDRMASTMDGLDKQCKACRSRPQQKFEVAQELVQKLCTHCRRLWPVACFYINRRRADGLHNYCRNCAALVDQIDMPTYKMLAALPMKVPDKYASVLERVRNGMTVKKAAQMEQVNVVAFRTALQRARRAEGIPRRIVLARK